MRKIATVGANRREAVRDGDGKYYGSVCKKDASHGNVRITSSGSCDQCHKTFQVVNAQRHYAKNSELYKQRAKTWGADHPEHRRVARAKFRNENRDAHNAYNRDWFKRNSALRNAYANARRAYKGKATIPGYESALQAIYQNCPEGFTVDHVVPLKGKRVCWLHVPWNLQYLPGSENIRKSNKLIESVAIAPAFESHTRQ
jgi:hypothetical protein